VTFTELLHDLIGLNGRRVHVTVGAPNYNPPAALSCVGVAKFRRETLAKTGGTCSRCGSAEGVQAHHEPAVADGGGESEGGEPLCKPYRAEHRC
jgi:hypothetical protein